MACGGQNYEDSGLECRNFAQFAKNLNVLLENTSFRDCRWARRTELSQGFLDFPVICLKVKKFDRFPSQVAFRTSAMGCFDQLVTFRTWANRCLEPVLAPKWCLQTPKS